MSQVSLDDESISVSTKKSYLDVVVAAAAVIIPSYPGLFHVHPRGYGSQVYPYTIVLL